VLFPVQVEFLLFRMKKGPFWPSFGPSSENPCPWRLTFGLSSATRPLSPVFEKSSVFTSERNQGLGNTGAG